MSQDGAQPRGRRAFTVQWRNHQARKNKSWESDGYMLVDGLGVTVYSEDGKQTTVPVEEEEFSIPGKREILVGDEITLAEFYKQTGGNTQPATVAPAQAKPGWLTRPGMLPAAGPATPRPAAARPVPAAAASPAPPTSSLQQEDPLASASKVWPSARKQKPFKPPSRSPSVGSAQVLALGKAGAGTPGPSRLREQIGSGRERTAAERQTNESRSTREGKAASVKGKGKARAVEGDAEDAQDDLENSPPSSAPQQQDDRHAPLKKRRVDAPARPLAAAAATATHVARASRLTAADAAFERALSRDSPAAPAGPSRTTSLPDRKGTPGKALFRRNSSPAPSRTSVSGQRGSDGVLEADALLEPADLEMELDAAVFGDDALEWSAEDMSGTEDGVEVSPQDGRRGSSTAKVAGGLKRGSSGANGMSGTSGTRRFSKKNPVWQGDGILVVNRLNGELQCAETGKRMAIITLKPDQTFEEGDIIRMGSHEVEPSPLENAARFAVPAPFKIPARAPKSEPAAGSTRPAPRKSGPKFDPNAEGALVMRRPDDEHEKVYNKKQLPVVDVVVDPIIGDKLRDHQREGVAFMYECVMGMRTAGQGCILADDMGLGKTVQAVALIWTLLKQNPYQGLHGGVIDRAMIVCPITVIKNWSAEIRKWLGRERMRVYVADSSHPVSTFTNNKSYDVLIIGYDKMRASIDDIRYAQPPIGLIVCDEGHRLKSEKAKTTQAIQSLSCMRRVILSGTPIQNNLGEFFAMMDFVNPGLFNSAAYFKKNFEQPILASRQPCASSKEKQAGKDASESLSTIQRNFVLRRTGDINLVHLPPKFEYTVFIRPSKLQLEVYREMLSSSLVRAVLEGVDRKQGFPLLHSALKLSMSPGLLIKQIKEKGLGHLDESILDVLPQDADPVDFALSGKLAALGTLLAQLRETEEKIVLVSNFTTTLDLIEGHCKRNKFPYCRLDGDWNPSNDLQAMARIHREGQKRTCFIYRFVTAGTIDEVIFQRQIIKLALSGSIMEQDGSAASKSKDSFTLDELRNLFTLHENVASQTHDLLGCRCHFGEHPDDDDDEEDDEDASSDGEDQIGGFVQASQFQDADAIRKMTKQRRNLSVLKTWTHYDCTDEQSIDEVEDELLQSVIYQRMSLADRDEEPLEVEGNGELSLRGGQISFVFGKKSGA
ncbi:hypothetical protein Rhopal_006741-T1 [Rhodotorula paludigena]|uniref:Helicase ATP-binding domain-containing protein n=1 Tax=Rhodotorula paludigena TaxID=86838 RepID=A0AAV5GT48_9BASI|nr:hypothetical protein Rhopal_006741-T1 [Rhodotorula paludigena]